MKLYYCQIESGNFGDDLNRWLWSSLLGPNYFDNDEDTLFLGVGSILSSSLPAQSQKLILGSGSGYKSPLKLNSRDEVYAVRGPLTAHALKIDPKCGISDGAYLCLETSEFQEIARSEKQTKAAIVPHHQSFDAIDWEGIALSTEATLVDPRQDFFEVFRQIASAECVLAESLHGAIIADALRIPWKPFRIGHRFNEFKWQDWLASIDINDCKILSGPILCDHELPLSMALKHGVKRLMGNTFGVYRWSQRPLRRSTSAEYDSFTRRLSEVIADHQFYLSSDSTLNSIRERLCGCVEQFLMRYPQFPSKAAA